MLSRPHQSKRQLRFLTAAVIDGSAGKAFIIDRRKGEVRQSINLPARATECGLAVAGEKLYLTSETGSLHCFSAFIRR